MGAGAIFEGLISGLNEGIGSVRAQNQRDAEIEMKTEQEILTTLAKTSENAQVRDDALEALLNLGQSGKPTGFIKTLLKQRGKNPDIARLISSARQAGVDPITGKQDMKAPVDTGGPPTAAPAPVESAPPIAFDQAPPMGGGEIPMPPAVAPLPSAPQGPAAQPINTTQHRTPISFSAGAQAPTPVSTAPAAFPPPPPASLPPAPPTASRFGVMSDLERQTALETIRANRRPTSGTAQMAREIADLTEEAALAGDAFPPEKSARLEALQQLAKVAYTPRDAALAEDRTERDTMLEAGRNERAAAGRSLELQANEALEKGDLDTYNRLLKVDDQFGKSGRPVKTDSGEKKALSYAMEANIINRLTTQWDAASKQVNELGRQVKLMDTGLAAARRGDLAQGAQAVLVTFQKILDPESVVRETEYARSAAGLAMMDRVAGYFEQLQKGGGGVPLKELEKFAQLAREAAKKFSEGALPAKKKRIAKTAERYGIPLDVIFEDYAPNFDEEGGKGKTGGTLGGTTSKPPAPVGSEVEELAKKLGLNVVKK